MPALALKNKRRYLVAIVLAMAIATGFLTFGAKPDAKAFDCFNTDPKPISCPFLKIEADDVYYYAEAWIVDPDGKEIHHWKEDLPDYTLWHWRYYGDDSTIKVEVTPFLNVNGSRKKGEKYPFQWPASESHCLLVNRAGVYSVGGCDDNEDPPK